MSSLLLLILLFQSYHTNNLFFPFKKLTIEFFNESKSISDFINFNIYTNISMGTPKKNVGHFIKNSDNSFYYDTLQLHYTGREDYNQIQKEIENTVSFYYFAKDSTSYEVIDDYDGLFSDSYLLYDLNQKEKRAVLEFNAMFNEMKLKVFGSLNLYYYRETDPAPTDRYLFSILKNNDLISNSYFTFFYGEYDLTYEFNYFNDNYDDILGNFIIGEYPHEYAPDKYKEDDQIKINGQFKLHVDEIKYKYEQVLNYSETDVDVGLKFDGGFIKGSIKYKNEIDKIFFNELFSKKLCKAENIDENIMISQKIIYSCENNDKIQKKIQSFPTLYFEIKTYNITFLFNYKELFKLHNNRLYFLIIFKNDSNIWEMSEIFFRKYLTTFDYYSKTIAFYKSQINDINEKTDIHDDPESDSDSEEPESDSDSDSEEPSSDTDSDSEEPTSDSDSDSDDPKSDSDSDSADPKSDTDGRTDDSDEEKKQLKKKIIIGCVVGGVVLIAAVVTIVLLVIKLRKNRKRRADELKDDFEYVPEDQVN